MANQWFKFFGMEYLSDPKMLVLNAAQRSCWITLLSYASIGETPGDVKYLNEEQLMIQSGVDFHSDEWKQTKGVIKRFVQLGMIEVDDNGTIRIKNWGKRQEYQAMTGYERVKKWREKQRDNGNDNAGDNGDNVQNRIEQNRTEKSNTLARSFNDFWILYPRKESKKKAMQAWVKISPDEELFKTILAGLHQHLSSEQWQKDKGRFIPHPTTWLNGERWKDELKVGAKKSSKYDNVKTTTIAV